LKENFGRKSPIQICLKLGTGCREIAMRECAGAEWAALGTHDDGSGRGKQVGQRWLLMSAESPAHQANGAEAGIELQKSGELRGV